ncbi:MAG: lysophospholipid acyltransferase family protein [Bradymonadia bacterium]
MKHAREIWAPNMFWVAGSKLEVFDEQHVDYTKPHIFVMNHQSHMDIPAAFMALPANIGFVAKKELESVPLFGRVMREAGMIFVDRSDPQKAIASLKRGGELIRSGVNIFAFPEGTRTKDGHIQSLKKGIFMLALEAGVPIVPMSVHGARDVLPIGSFDPQPGTIKVKIGKPIPLENHSIETRDELMAEVHGAIVQLNLELGGAGTGVA